MNEILVATDGSPSSVDAVTFAVELGVGHRAALVFVHVVPAHARVLPAADVVPADGADELGAVFPPEPTEHDHKVLEHAAAVAAAHGVPATTVLLGGSTAKEIVAYAETGDVDLIVVVSRGHSRITSALLGSVSLGVLRHSTRPVLVVHGAVQLGHHPMPPTASPSHEPARSP